MPEQVPSDLLQILKVVKSKAMIAQSVYDALVQEVAMLYKLSEGDNLDIATGTISRKEAARQGIGNDNEGA